MTEHDIAGTPEGRVAERISELRDERGLSQGDLAQLCHEAGFPFSVDAIQRLERGQRRVNVNTLVGLACALNVSPLVLILPTEGGDGVELTSSVTAPGGEVYEWFVGARPAPTSERTYDPRFEPPPELSDEERVAVWSRFRMRLPYATRTFRTIRVDEINKDNVVELFRDSNREREDR
jgi:transcriptional regulator with XRE-family HTH domain